MSSLFYNIDLVKFFFLRMNISLESLNSFISMATQHDEKYLYPRILRILTDIGQAVAGFCKRNIAISKQL